MANLKRLTRSLNLMISTGFATVLAALFVGLCALPSTAMAQNGLMGPRFEVDAQWPKPLPNRWVLGSATGVSVDADDHVWIIQGSAGAPPVLEFDQAGNLLRHWGGPGQGYEWPDSPHGIFIDYKGNVWIGGNGPNDSQILKFTKDGTFVMQAGKKGAHGDSNDQVSFGRVAKIWVDQKDNEAYIADGYLNKRVAVIDADTGKMKRWWGAYGNKPDDKPLPAYDPSALPAQQFRNPVCANLSNNRQLYVCDQAGDRLQVFAPDGTFIREEVFDMTTKKVGQVSDIAFDPEQRYIFMADGVNEMVKIVLRGSLKMVTAFGAGGRQPGQFNGLNSIATDSKGNIYTAEAEGKRVQRFVFKGIGPVYTRNQGVLPALVTSR
jgi:hypothetical protein